MSDTLTVREMRQRITRSAFHGGRVDGKKSHMPAPASVMVRNILALGEREGWSGEDTMTMLAYYALLGYEGMYDLVSNYTLTSLMPLVQVKDEKGT